MFIIEKIIKSIIKSPPKTDEAEEEGLHQEETCEHIFLPLDSTKKHLACSKCGLITEAPALKKARSSNFISDNFFRN